MYPHIHLIPRRNGDMSDPRGGVRHVIPEKGNYKRDKKKEEEDKQWAEMTAHQERFDF